MRLLLSTAALLGAAAIGGTAEAQTVNFGTLCGGTTGATACASVSAQLFSSHLEVYVQNAEGPTGVGDPSRITGIGLYYFGPSMGPTGTLAAPVPGGDWSDGFGAGGGALDNPGPLGDPMWLVAASASGPGGIWGCTDPTGGTTDVSSCAGPLTFRFEGINSGMIRLGDLELAFRAQSVGDAAASVKCYPTDPSTSAQACMPISTVPEPSTVALLGLGLFGIGGVGVARRRGRAQR